MTDPSTQLQSYEVRCPRCDVSFPPETRICVHCGGRVGRGRIARVMGVEDPANRMGLDPASKPFAFDDDDIGEQRSRSPLRFLGSVLWIVIFVVYWYARSCNHD